MKIAIFVHCFFPNHFYGTETYTLQLARNLKEMGHEPVVVSAVFQGEPSKGVLVSHYEYEGIPVYCIDKNLIRHSSIRETYYQPAMRSVLKDLLSDIKPDLVHVTHLINHTAALLDVTKELGLPTVATLTDFFGFCFNNKLEASDGSLCKGPDIKRINCIACFFKADKYNHKASYLRTLTDRYPRLAATACYYLRFMPLVGRRCAGTVLDIIDRPGILSRCYSNYRAVIAPTKFLMEAYLANGFNTPSHLIHFGTDIERAPKPERVAGAPVIFGFIGQIAPHKGVDILVDAFRRLPKGKAGLYVFGPEDQSPAYMASLRAKAEGYDVHFKGIFPKERMAKVFSEIDFLVIPSRWYENSPLVLLDALASHTPVIVSDVKGMTEFIEDGKNGFIFSRSDAGDLERVLKNIIADPDKSRAMSLTTEYKKTIKMMVEDVLAVYDLIRSN